MNCRRTRRHVVNLKYMAQLKDIIKNDLVLPVEAV